MEYLTFGPLLMRCRLAFLPELQGARCALVLGDGDGRFTARLLRENKTVSVHAVDGSAAMLRESRERARREDAADRLFTYLQDARVQLPGGPFDLVCTHFFLDCLTDGEVAALAAEVRQRMPTGLWLVSEFAVPKSAARWSARPLIFLLYQTFRLLTGLQVQSLPDHAAALRGAGFVLVERREHLFGILRAELWSVVQHEW